MGNYLIFIYRVRQIIRRDIYYWFNKALYVLSFIRCAHLQHCDFIGFAIF